MLAFNKWESQPASPWFGHMQLILMKHNSLFNLVFLWPVGSEDQLRWAVGGAPGWDLRS